MEAPSRSDIRLGSATLKPGIFVQFGGGFRHTPTPKEFGTLGADGAAVLGGVSAGVNRFMLSFNALDMMTCPAKVRPRLLEIPATGNTTGLQAQNDQVLADAKCSGVSETYSYSADVITLVPRTPVLIGGGVRMEEKRPTYFGSAGLGWIRNNGQTFIAVRANVGEDYRAGIVSIAIRLGGE